MEFAQHAAQQIQVGMREGGLAGDPNPWSSKIFQEWGSVFGNIVSIFEAQLGRDGNIGLYRHHIPLSLNFVGGGIRCRAVPWIR